MIVTLRNGELIPAERLALLAEILETVARKKSDVRVEVRDGGLVELVIDGAGDEP